MTRDSCGPFRRIHSTCSRRSSTRPAASDRVGPHGTSAGGGIARRTSSRSATERPRCGPSSTTGLAASTATCSGAPRANGPRPARTAQVIVRELIANTPEAYRALWRFALSVELTRSARQRFAAIDEPLQFLVNEPQALGMRLVDDELWLRLLDVPGALAARRYAAPVDVVIEVTDPNIPANAGRFRLVGGPTIRYVYADGRAGRHRGDRARARLGVPGRCAVDRLRGRRRRPGTASGHPRRRVRRVRLAPRRLARSRCSRAAERSLTCRSRCRRCRC